MIEQINEGVPIKDVSIFPMDNVGFWVLKGIYCKVEYSRHCYNSF